LILYELCDFLCALWGTGFNRTVREVRPDEENETMRRQMSAVRILVCWLFAIVCSLGTQARAHNGPPFPIIENKKIGPFVISLWTHPDVGIGTFFVLVDPPPGSKIPDDLKIGIGVQPESGRLPEVVYSATREDNRGQAEYKALAEFDRDEFWRVRLVLQSAQGSGEMLSRVEATPPGFGRWDLLLYLLPFLAVGFLWFRGMTRVRNRRKKLQVA
jgi:hypothetical protein